MDDETEKEIQQEVNKAIEEYLTLAMPKILDLIVNNEIIKKQIETQERISKSLEDIVEIQNTRLHRRH